MNYSYISVCLRKVHFYGRRPIWGWHQWSWENWWTNFRSMLWMAWWNQETCLGCPQSSKSQETCFKNGTTQNLCWRHVLHERWPYQETKAPATRRDSEQLSCLSHWSFWLWYKLSWSSVMLCPGFNSELESRNSMPWPVTHCSLRLL